LVAGLLEETGLNPVQAVTTSWRASSNVTLAGPQGRDGAEGSNT
jgi:hypothetical protein